MCFTLLFSCSEEEKVDIPDYVIPPHEMDDVLLDIQLMQSHINQERTINPFILDSVNALYNSVYEKHNITQQKLDTSLVFYSKHITIMDSIYNNVFAELKALELELKDVKYTLPNIKYLNREELINVLKQFEIKDYLIQDTVTFISARDSLGRFIKHNKLRLDSIQIMPAQLKNSFAVYANSKKRMEQLKADLK